MRGLPKRAPQYFPSLILTGRYGSESSDLANLFSGPALVWSVAASALQPIFEGGRIAAQVDAATARRQQVELDYLQTVQSAFRDTHDALVAQSQCARELYRPGRASGPVCPGLHAGVCALIAAAT